MSQTVYEHASVHLILYYLNELTLRCVISQYQPAFYRVIDHLVTNNRPLLSVSVRRKTLSIINDSPSSHQTGRIIQMCICSLVLFGLQTVTMRWELRLKPTSAFKGFTSTLWDECGVPGPLSVWEMHTLTPCKSRNHAVKSRIQNAL